MVKGTATLEIEKEGMKEIEEGGDMTIAPHAKHRVERTDEETVWVAVFWYHDCDYVREAVGEDVWNYIISLT